jgi:creatinine amidohydrolase
MALAPDLVGALPPADRPAFPRPFLVRNTRAYWKSGVWGDPGKASRAKGEQMIAILSRNLAKMAESMRNQKKNEGRKRK